MASVRCSPLRNVAALRSELGAVDLSGDPNAPTIVTPRRRARWARWARQARLFAIGVFIGIGLAFSCEVDVVTRDARAWAARELRARGHRATTDAPVERQRGPRIAAHPRKKEVQSPAVCVGAPTFDVGDLLGATPTVNVTDLPAAGAVSEAPQHRGR